MLSGFFFAPSWFVSPHIACSIICIIQMKTIPGNYYSKIILFECIDQNEDATIIEVENVYPYKFTSWYNEFRDLLSSRQKRLFSFIKLFAFKLFLNI